VLHQRAYIAGVALAIRKENNRKGNNAFRDKTDRRRHSINLTIKAQLPGPETAGTKGRKKRPFAAVSRLPIVNGRKSCARLLLGAFMNVIQASCWDQKLTVTINLARQSRIKRVTCMSRRREPRFSRLWT